MKRFFKVIELLLDEEAEAFLDSVSIVDKPAIERGFIAFSEDKPMRLIFNDDQMTVLGPAMIPNQRIPRTDENGDVYFVYFSPETIKIAADLFLKKDKASKNNVNHVPMYSDKLHVMESWIKESDNDKSTDYGYKDLPVGTWFVSMKVDDVDTWNRIKSGELNGFSVEGAFMFGPENLESVSFARHKRKYTDIRRRYRKVYKGLSEQEKREMDALIFLLEELRADQYENSSDAVARSKELGLEGRIHSHTEEGKTYYMPGETHDEYELALLNMDVDVSDLPDYVDPGATGDLISEGYRSYVDYPQAASENARKALEWREKYPNEVKAGTRIGWTRANQLAKRLPISEETIGRMAAFERHRSNSRIDADKKGKPWTDNGYVAWLIWGGTEGIEWAQRKIKQLNREKDYFVEVSPGESKDDYIGRCMSALQGEFPDQDQRYAVCISEWQGSSDFAAVEDLQVGNAVSWSTADQNPRGRIREIVREGSKKVPGRDFEVNGTPEDPGYIIEIYEQNAEGNWEPTGEYVGRKADSILKNVEL